MNKKNNIFKAGIVIIIIFTVSGINFTQIIKSEPVEQRMPEYWALFFNPFGIEMHWRDALVTLKNVLLSNGWTNDPEDPHIKEIYDEEATEAELKSQITGWLGENVSPMDTVLICIYTHGNFNGFVDITENYDDPIKYYTLDSWLDNHLKSINIAIIIDSCYSHKAICALKQDGRVIATSLSPGEDPYEHGGFGMAMTVGLDVFGDVRPGGSIRDGVTSIKEAVEYVDYDDGFDYTPMYYSCYPVEDPEYKDELHITFQNWEDGRIDQFPAYNYIYTYYGGVKTYKVGESIYHWKVAQTFTPSCEYLTKIRIYMKKHLNPQQKIYASINKAVRNEFQMIVGPGDMLTGAETYISHSEVYKDFSYITFDFQEDISVDPEETYFFILYTKDIETNKDKTYYLAESDFNMYGGEDHFVWEFKEEEDSDKWKTYPDQDILFATYGYNEDDNNPPYIPLRPSGPSSTIFGKEESYSIKIEDVDDDLIQYAIDWGDGSPWVWSALKPSGAQYTYTESHSWEGEEERTYFVKVKARDQHNAESKWSDVLTVNAHDTSPDKPDINGPDRGTAGVEYDFTFITNDPEKEDVFYYIDWGDGDIENWIGPYSSGEEITRSHTWTDKGNYKIRAKAKDIHDAESDWGSLTISIPRNHGNGITQGTQITMAIGNPVTTKPVETLQVGELISSYNPISQTVTIAEVIEICEYTENLPECLIFNSNLEVTPEHTMYINQIDWMKANDTGIGYLMLKNIPGTPEIQLIPITSKEPSSINPVCIYDLVIQPVQGEACGYWANGILVGGYD